MKKTTTFTLLVISLLLVNVAFTSCSKSGDSGLSDADQQAFETAIASYCKSKNMGMAVKSFEKSDLKDNQGTITCRMKAIDGPPISVKWTFKVKKENDKWQILSHD